MIAALRLIVEGGASGKNPTWAFCLSGTTFSAVHHDYGTSSSTPDRYGNEGCWNNRDRVSRHCNMENVMAIFEQKEKKHYCKVVWMEAGRSVTRRLTQLSIVTSAGLVYHLTGKDLPDVLIIQTGPTVGGNPTAEVLLPAKSKKLERALGKASAKQQVLSTRDLMIIATMIVVWGTSRLVWYFSQLSQ